MKKYVLFFALGCSTGAFTQTPITFDFNTNFPKEKEIKGSYKEKFVIIVNDVNRKLFKVETNETKTNFNITMPSALKSIKLPSFLALSLPQASSRGLSLPVKALDSDDASSYHTRIEELLALIERRGKKLDRGSLLYNTLNKTFKNCSLSYSEIETALKSSLHTYLELNGQAGDYTVVSLRTHLSDTLNAMYSEASKALKELERIVPNYIALMNNDQRSALQSLEERRPARRNAPADLLDQIASIKTSIEIFKQQEALLKEQVKEARELVNAMYEFEKDDKINMILSLASIMSNNNNFKFQSEEIKANKDEIRYKITISPEELNACGITDKKVSEVVIKTKGGLKIDFSTGVFLLGGKNKFLGESYYWQKIDSATRSIVTAERGSRLQLGIGALAHFYQRSYSKIKLGGSLGVSTSAGFDDLNFHIGPSLIVGNKDRLIFSGGLALKSTKVLDRNLQTGTSYAKDNSPDDIPTVSQFPVSGWFIGITYNISRFNSE